MISAAKIATCTVVVSKGQSRNPEKRALEQAIAEAAAALDGVQVIVVPHLYDLPRDSESYRQLAAVEGDLVVFSWIYGRAAHWVLDRNGIRGQTGAVELGREPDDEDQDGGNGPDAMGLDDAAGQEPSAGDSDDNRVSDWDPRPDRQIFCVDLKHANRPEPFVDEIRRILGLDDVGGEPDTALPVIGGKLIQVDDATSRRWYPVIDFDRCTNCMECIDFCLFGVYGVDGAESILVEQPDNCRKGCPACSRVCPENAIIFPQHKAPAIAGAEVEGNEGFKIDLSQLFGAPAKDEDPIAVAARERDEQLLLSGRDAVGIDDQLRRRQADLASQPKDHLDSLIDSLDEFDL